MTRFKFIRLSSQCTKKENYTKHLQQYTNYIIVDTVAHFNYGFIEYLLPWRPRVKMPVIVTTAVHCSVLKRESGC